MLKIILKILQFLSFRFKFHQYPELCFYFLCEFVIYINLANDYCNSIKNGLKKNTDLLKHFDK